MNYELFGFIIEVVVTVHFVFIVGVAGVLSVKAFGWLWDKTIGHLRGGGRREKK